MSQSIKRIRTPQRTKRRYLLVAGSLAIGSGLAAWLTLNVSAKTHEYLVAASSLASGAPINASSFVVQSLSLGDSGSLYLQPSDFKSSGYLLQSVQQGQLVAKSEVSTAIIDARQPVVVTSTMSLPTALSAGDSVDVWTSSLNAKNKFDPPSQVVLNAEVTEVRQPSGVFGDQRPEVQLLVPVAAVSPILAAIADKDAISLVLKRNLGHD